MFDQLIQNVANFFFNGGFFGVLCLVEAGIIYIIWKEYQKEIAEHKLDLKTANATAGQAIGENNKILNTLVTKEDQNSDILLRLLEKK